VLRLPAQTRGHRVDYLGAGLAAAFSTGLLLVTEWGGKQYGWTSPVVLGLIGGCVVSLALFVWRQATAAEPILPLPLFRDRVLRIGFAVQALMGMALTGSMVYVLIYLQVVRGLNSTDAGLFLLPMAAGMTGVGLLAGRLVTAGWSQRTFVICGSAAASVAMLLLATTHTDTSLWLIRAELLLLGVGFGQLIGQLIQLVQAAAPAHQLGVATTAVRFFQTLGGALGASLFGTLLARVFADRTPVPGATTSSLPLLHGAQRAAVLHAFTSSTDTVLLAAAGVMALAFVLALRLPRLGKAETESGTESGTGTGTDAGEGGRLDVEMAA
jgi:predicted MFS family arabinose efflux permease